MAQNQGATVATFALGTVQSAVTTLDLFSGTPLFLPVSVLSPGAAKELVQALSGTGD
jgi:hypothetical protein